MSNSLIARYRLWFDYEKDSHAKTLDSLNSVSKELRESVEFRKAVYLLGHIVAARRMWLFRFGVLKENVELFPREVTFAELPNQIAAMETMWSQYLNQLDDAALARVFEYQSYEGPRFRNTIEEILIQLFGHSWYHRGQIAQLVRSMGAKPAVTDFVFWSREPVDELV
ncbi:MAG: DinB family protein [Acidobacteriota bacterium]|nr:DinB family protein [Acidobacteriota bacterium]